MPITSNHFTRRDGTPDGGNTFGTGFAIGWQCGPLGRGDRRVPPNGAFVEDVICAALDRLEFYQRTTFACRENEDAIDWLYRALGSLAERTEARVERGVEGTHQV